MAPIGQSAAVFDGVHEGETVVIMGTAPSLKELDVERLMALPVIACNAIYEYPGAEPEYVLFADRRPYIRALPAIKERAGDAGLLLSDTIWDRTIKCGGSPVQKEPSFRHYVWHVGTCRTEPNWQTFSQPLCSFATTAGAMLQAAVIMGAARVALAGIDMKAPKKGSIHFYDDKGGRAEATIQRDGETMGPDATWKRFAEVKAGLNVGKVGEYGGIVNLSPRTDSPIADIFGNYDFEQFCEEEGI